MHDIQIQHNMQLIYVNIMKIIAIYLQWPHQTRCFPTKLVIGFVTNIMLFIFPE